MTANALQLAGYSQELIAQASSGHGGRCGSSPTRSLPCALPFLQAFSAAPPYTATPPPAAAGASLASPGGSRKVPYQKTWASDGEDTATATAKKGNFATITAMSHYLHISLEELRYAQTRLVTSYAVKTLANHILKHTANKRTAYGSAHVLCSVQ